MDRPTISISIATFAKALLLVILCMVLYLLKDLVMVVLTAIIIATAIEPATIWLKNHRIPRLPAVIIVYVILFLIIAGILYFIVPQLLTETLTGLDTFDAYLKSSHLAPNASVASLRSVVQGLSGDITLKEAATSVGSSFSTVSGGFFQLASLFFGGLVSFIIIIVLSFYLSVQNDGVGEFLRIITPVRHEKYVTGLWKRSQTLIGRWMQGQLLLTLIVGILVYLGLLILGVKDALILTLFAMICELIPLFGPVIGAVPAVLFSYISGGLSFALIVVGLYLIIHQLENHLIYPLVVKKIVGINPVIVIISLIAGFELAGFLGIIIAVPLATVGMEYLRDIERGKVVPVQ